MKKNPATKQTPATDAPDPARDRRRRLQHLREKLAKERHNWTRWMTRLKRAFHTIEKIQRRGTRLERQIARLEQE